MERELKIFGQEMMQAPRTHNQNMPHRQCIPPSDLGEIKAETELLFYLQDCIASPHVPGGIAPTRYAVPPGPLKKGSSPDMLFVLSRYSQVLFRRPELLFYAAIDALSSVTWKDVKSFAWGRLNL